MYRMGDNVLVEVTMEASPAAKSHFFDAAADMCSFMCC